VQASAKACALIPKHVTQISSGRRLKKSEILRPRGEIVFFGVLHVWLPNHVRAKIVPFHVDCFKKSRQFCIGQRRGETS
jgi:hypothetical protein